MSGSLRGSVSASSTQTGLKSDYQTRRVQTLLAAGVLSLLMSCAESSPARPSPPPPAQGGGAPTPTSPPSVSGTVDQTAPEGRRPLPGAPLAGHGSSRWGPQPAPPIYADGDGRYTIPGTHAVDGGIAGVFADGGAGLLRHQPCVATIAINGATTLDVEYNAKDVPGTARLAHRVRPPLQGDAQRARSRPDQASPLLREERPGGFTPTPTIAARHEFCNVPVGPGKVLMDPFDWELGRPAAEQSITVTGDIVVDLLES